MEHGFMGPVTTEDREQLLAAALNGDESAR